MDEEETAEEKEAGNPRTTFNTTLVNLMKGLVQHLNPDKAVDEMLHDFFGGRLPPYGKGVKKGNFIRYICNIVEVIPEKKQVLNLAAFSCCFTLLWKS